MRNREPERLGGLQIDDQMELGHLFERNVARLRSPEDLVDQTYLSPSETTVKVMSSAEALSTAMRNCLNVMLFALLGYVRF